MNHYYNANVLLPQWYVHATGAFVNGQAIPNTAFDCAIDTGTTLVSSSNAIEGTLSSPLCRSISQPTS